MDPWQVFLHSVKMVIRNGQDAAKIALVPFGVMLVAQYALIGETLARMSTATTPEALAAVLSEPGVASGLVFFGLIAVLVTTWIIVSWHRFVLLEEYPEGWLPPFRFGLILGYYGRFLMLGILLVLAMVPVTMVAAALGVVGLVLIPVGLVAMTVAFYRLSLILPAAAVERRLTLADAWQASRGESMSLLLLVVILFGATVVVQIPVLILSALSAALGALAGAFVNALSMLVGSSVLTTLYGVLVEGRDID